jgi:hypothetical protein
MIPLWGSTRGDLLRVQEASVFRRIRRLVTDLRGLSDVQRLLATASKLEAAGRYAEATEVLKGIRATAAHPEMTGAMVGVHASNRLTAATLLATTAARIGERAVALDAIEEGLRLWAEVKPHMRAEDTLRRMNAWEAWARRYAGAQERH